MKKGSGKVFFLFEEPIRRKNVCSLEEYRQAQPQKASTYLRNRGVRAHIRIQRHELILELFGENSLSDGFPIDLFRAVAGIVRGVQQYEGLVYDGEFPDRARSPNRKDIVYAWARSKGILRPQEEAQSTILLYTSVPGCETITIPVLVEEGPRGA